MTIVRNSYIYLVYVILGFSVKGLASAMYLDRPSLLKALGRTGWVATEQNLYFFGAKGHWICSPPLNIAKRFLLVEKIPLYGQKIEFPLS